MTLALLLAAVALAWPRAARELRVRRLAGVLDGQVGPVRRWRRGPRRRRDAAADVGAALAHVASTVRAGGGHAAAWRAALGVGVDAYGVPDVAELERRLRGAGAQAPDAAAQAGAVVAACRVSGEVGAPLAAVLGTVGAALAADVRARDDRDAALAGPRATITVLTWLPVVGVLLGAVLGADPVSTLLDGGIGTGCLLGGALLLCAGRAWTRRLVDRARRDGAPA